MLRLLIQLGLLCCLVLPVVLALEELEWDVQVAPTTVGQYSEQNPIPGTHFTAPSPLYSSSTRAAAVA